MMRNFLMAGVCLLAASCSSERFNEVVNGQSEEAVAAVKVHVDEFSVSLEDDSRGRTRAVQDVATYNDVNAVTLAFYKGDGSQVYKHEQLRDSESAGETFGEFECALPMGSYTMVVVAYKTNESSPFSLTSPTVASYTGDHAYDTFVTTQAVNITNTDAVDIGAILNRVVSKLEVRSSDGRTTTVQNVRMTLSEGSKSFNPTNGLAIVNTGFANTVSISRAEGELTTSGTYLFLATDEQTMDVTIESLDADGNPLFSKVVNNVPFKRNRKTILTGNIYTNNNIAGAFQIETAWLDDHIAPF